MIDGHVHLEKGPLTIEYLNRFVEEAQKKGIDELQILNHSHRFRQFAQVYEPFKIIEPQIRWFSNDMKDDLDDYMELISKAKEMEWPVKLRFGLEICYNKENEDKIKDVLDRYHFDFVIGSVHFVDRYAYDCDWSVEHLWSVMDTDKIYRDYYDEMLALADSGMFTQIGHPDTIKMFNYYPSYDLTDTYNKLIDLCNKNHMKVEENVGCYYRYGHKDLGLSDELLELCIRKGADLITVSDAHVPEHVGSYIKEACDRIARMREEIGDVR